ncbi:DUF952 domain-containing protein [Halomonas borealis]|jgi:uncharacterized protein (DUF952 family)|uniref:DUF952 domain-containing protein n=1 Tax=Halomonas borealis TaxID=2508710 RepID=UPI00109F8CAF|nr:DUF952 domain-containing protein [Halomonas borealis]
MASLYRVLPQAAWDAACRSGVVPRCGNDHRADGVNLNLAEAVPYTVHRYFVREERPVVLEVDSAGLAEHIEWRAPLPEEPWARPLARIPELPVSAVISVRAVSEAELAGASLGGGVS